ncbi:MAG: hypothetical protein P4N41_23170 [Negativicutes bacterium]|nr:hypothetical protein [Negativicutes bacterium]
MRKSLVTFLTGMIVAASMAGGYHPPAISQGVDGTQPVRWTDSIKNYQDSDSPRLFTIITDIEKYLTDRKIGVNIVGDRYELLYKRIY